MPIYSESIEERRRMREDVGLPQEPEMEELGAAAASTSLSDINLATDDPEDADTSPGVADFSTVAHRGSATKAKPVRLDKIPDPIDRSTPRPKNSRMSREMKNLMDFNRPGLKEEQVEGRRRLRSGRSRASEALEEKDEDVESSKL